MVYYRQMKKLDKKKVEQIANFIVNNITMAEVTAMIIERATETAEFIVENEIAPDNFNSPVSRKKLHTKITNFKKEAAQKKEDSWYHNIINKIVPSKKEEELKEHKGFTTKK